MSARGFSTQQVHGGTEADGQFGARVAPLHLTAGFVFDDWEQARDRFSGAVDGYNYTRLGNPTNADVERRVALLEGGSEALLVASGQAAVTIALLAIVQAGDHIVSAGSLYAGSRNLLAQNLARLGVETTFVADANDPRAWEAAVRPNTRVFFGESIPNPKNDLLDIAAVARIAHAHAVPLVIDNTLASPYLLRPIEWGADVVVHSAGKFLAGHGTALGGLIVDSGRFDWTTSKVAAITEPDPLLGGDTWVSRLGNRAWIVYAKDIVAGRFGPAPAPFNAFLIRQGIETLSLRVARQSASALAVAGWLEQRDDVESVDYCGLESSPYHGLATELLPNGFGSVFAFTVRGGLEAAVRCYDATKLISRMTHLGDVRTLILHPGSTTHAPRTEEQRLAEGITPGLLRLSIGVEDVPDLIADLEQALAAAALGAREAAAR